MNAQKGLFCDGPVRSAESALAAPNELGRCALRLTSAEHGALGDESGSSWLASAPWDAASYIPFSHGAGVRSAGLGESGCSHAEAILKAQLAIRPIGNMTSPIAGGGRRAVGLYRHGVGGVRHRRLHAA